MKQQRGFSLLEVLVALLVFSFGLMGLAGLQLVGLASNHSATIRMMATTMAYDMADRMRANRVAVIAGDYNGNGGADNACRATHYADVHATPANCTTTQLAGDDVFDWLSAVAAQLPGGTGSICIDSTPNDDGCDGAGTAYAVKVWWNDKPKNEVAVTKRVSIGFQP